MLGSSISTVGARLKASFAFSVNRIVLVFRLTRTAYFLLSINDTVSKIILKIYDMGGILKIKNFETQFFERLKKIR